MQTNREIAELIAQFRMLPGMNWEPLADDIETVLNMKDQYCAKATAR